MSASPFNYSTVSSPGSNAKTTASRSSSRWGFTTFKERREKKYREQVRQSRQQDFYDRRDYSVNKDLEKEQHIQRIRWDAARQNEEAKLSYRSRERWSAFRDDEAQEDIASHSGRRRAEFDHAQKLRHTGDFQSQRVSHEDSLNRTSQGHAAAMGDIHAESARKMGEAKAQTAFDVNYSTTYGRGKGQADATTLKADADARAATIRARGQVNAAKLGVTTATHEAEQARIRATGTQATARGDASATKIRAKGDASASEIRATGHVNARQILSSAPSFPDSAAESALTGTAPKSLASPRTRLGGAVPTEPTPRRARPAVTGGDSTRSYGPLSPPKASAPATVNPQQIPAPKQRATRTKKSPVSQGQQSLDLNASTPSAAKPRTASTQNPAPIGGTPVSQLHSSGPMQSRQLHGRTLTQGHVTIPEDSEHEHTPSFTPGIERSMKTRMAEQNHPGWRMATTEETGELEARRKGLGRA